MSSGKGGVIELLLEIKEELEIQLAKKTDREITMDKLLKLSDLMSNRLINCGLNKETIESLVVFASSIYVKSTTHEALRSHLNNADNFLKALS